MIDELETHLHIELQKKILPFLTEFFPHIQFIVTTHSPYILNSIANARAYDLEKHMELDNAYMYKADDLAEGYFDVDDFSNDMKKKFAEYARLVDTKDIKEATSFQIEHLIPYRGDVELKYDWNNLLWACAHCNNIKLDKYDPIIDCTKEDVEKKEEMNCIIFQSLLIQNYIFDANSLCYMHGIANCQVHGGCKWNRFS